MARIEKRRKCKICGTTLSRYNYSDICFHHQVNTAEGVEFSHLSETKCSSRRDHGLITEMQYEGRGIFGEKHR